MVAAGYLGVFSVVAGLLVGVTAPALRGWIDSRAELNRAKARALDCRSAAGRYDDVTTP